MAGLETVVNSLISQSGILSFSQSVSQSIISQSGILSVCTVGQVGCEFATEMVVSVRFLKGQTKRLNSKLL